MKMKHLPFICSAIGLSVIALDTLFLIGQQFGGSTVTIFDAFWSLFLTVGIWVLGFLTGKSVDK